MKTNVEKLSDVLSTCIHCDEKGERECDDCPVCSQGLVTDCIPAIVPTDEELVIIAKAGREVIKRLARKRYDQIGQQRELDRSSMDTQFDYMIRPHDKHPILISGPAPGVQHPLVSEVEFNRLSERNRRCKSDFDKSRREFSNDD